jgi:hypothetical protein
LNETPVFTTDVDLTATVFIKANSLEEAGSIAATFGEQYHIELQVGYWHWFSKIGFDPDQDGGLPITLASALKVVRSSRNYPLEQRWPD